MPVEELVDLERLRRDGLPPRPSDVRAALPPGWVLDEDGRTAHRDGRVMFSQGWILVAGLVSFGAAAIGLFWMTFPRGWAGVSRALILLVALIVIGGLVAPGITRALHRR